MKTRKSTCFGVVLIALLAAARISGNAAPQSGDEPTWIELTGEHFIVLTDTNEDKGIRLLEDLESRYAAYAATVFPVQRRQFPIRALLLDVRQEFEEFLPDSVKTDFDLRNNAIPERSAYLFHGDTEVFMVFRDRGVDTLSDDVGHSLGHLLLARSVLWQPFWLQEAGGEFVRMLGRGDGDDPVDAEDAYALDELIEIVPSGNFNDLGDGGAFRRQSYHLFRVLMEDHPAVLTAYLEALGDEDGYDAQLGLDDSMLEAVRLRVLDFEDSGLPLTVHDLQPTIRVASRAEADLEKGDLAAAADLQTLAREHYQRSRLDNARLGLVRLSASGQQAETARRGLQQLVVELPDIPMVHYHFGSLDAATSEERGPQIAALERAIELMPLLGRAYSELGRLYVETGRPGDAIRVAGQAIALEPEFADRAFEVIMNAQVDLGNHEAATAAAQTAATLPHADPATLEHYALLVPELYRTLETIRRAADSNRLEELRREVESLANDRDPRPRPATGGAIPYGLVFYDASSDPPDGVSEPQLFSGDLPEYSPDLRRRRIQGQVTIDVDLDRQGRVTGTRIRSSDDEGLSMAVIEALSRWRFDPARRNEESVEFSFLLTFTFDLQE